MHDRSILLVAAFALGGCGPSMTELDELAAAGRVQPDAPLHAKQSIRIAASSQHVWAVLTDFAGWPSWHAAITSAAAPSLEPGATLQWTNEGNQITSRFARVEAPRELVWTGSVSLAKAIHIWRLSGDGPDHTSVEVEETLDGFLLTWFYSQAQLDVSVGSWLADLKTAAER